VYKQQDFEKLDILLIDGDGGALQGVRHILFNAGVRNLRMGSSRAELSENVTRYSPDLILTEVRLPDGDILDLLTALRAGKVGHNPFAVVIAMIAPTEEQSVALSALDAGIDDIVAKPVSSANLMERIRFMVEKRRPYVVNGDYVGPKRKQDETAKTIEAPNTFAEKLKGGKPGFLEIEMAVQAAEEDIKGCRLQTIGDEMAEIVARIAPKLEQGNLDDTLRGGLTMLIDETNKASKQLADSRYEHVGELCSALGAVASRLRALEGLEADLRQALLLRPLIQAIRAGFEGGIQSADAARAIVQRIGL